MAANELRIHRLVQEVVRHKMDERTLRAVHAAVAVLISAVWPYVSGTDPTRNQAWRVPIAERYTPHICKLEDLFGPDMRDGKYDGTATSGYVFSSYAWYIAERGIPDQSEVFASLAQKILNKALHHGAADEERITHWLGEAHHISSLAACLTGSSDGTEHANTWLSIVHDRIMKYNDTSDRLALATAYNQMGICLVNKDQIEDAMDSFQKSLTIFRSVEDAPQFSGTFPALSLSHLFTLRGRPDEGEEVLAPVLEEHERILGEDDTSTTECGHIWRAMGNIRSGQQRYDEALQYHDRAVKNIRVTLGEKHYFTGDCFYSLAAELERKGDYKRAIENLDGAIEAFTAASHREAQGARAIWRKGCLLKKMGDDSTSIQLSQQAMALRRGLVPFDNRPVERLNDEDWTKLVIYWSR
ncbi:hypothetical protein QBC46DRAFT_381661 [Diplogelasinospora grovesii]|uniref:Uncharacterized protein n=1 Tax=Diplogelasinospora grovesii TaxID=303347 RepID=A0AAN6NCT8_9PEZI|nr:hypothetical protein QBC46DRAFT_381661 [Diplogelasinospora grovesii]